MTLWILFLVVRVHFVWTLLLLLTFTCSKGANPVISDILGLSPLHHAVLNNQEETVSAILEFFPASYVVRYTIFN